MKQDKRKIKKKAKTEIERIRLIRDERDKQVSTNIKTFYNLFLNWISNQIKFINTQFTYLQPLSPNEFSRDLVESMWNELVAIENQVKRLATTEINDDNSKTKIDTVRLEFIAYTMLPLIYQVVGLRKIIDETVNSYLFDLE